jgi:hypothetical protein
MSEKDIKLPQGIAEEKYNEVREIILSGFEADQEPDVIKSAIFDAGVPFSKLMVLYNAITKAENLVIDVKELKTLIYEKLQDTELTFKESYGELKTIIDTVGSDIAGYKTQYGLTVLKVHFEENEVKFPKKPTSSKGRMGVIAKIAIDCFAANKETSEEELKTALIDVTKAPESAIKYARLYHKMMYAAANGMTANEVLSHFSN